MTDLHAMRDRYGAKSPEGRACATLIAQLKRLPGDVPQPWATHESQTLRGKIRWQVAHLKTLLA
jgi:hypothetical protein